MSAPAPSKPTPSEPELLRTLWQRMHGKGLLLRDGSRRAHVHAPAQPRATLRTPLVSDPIHKTVSNAGKARVLAAPRGHVSARERAEIRPLRNDGKKS